MKSKSECARGEPEKDESDVKVRKWEHDPEGILERSRQLLQLHTGGLTVLMAAYSALSISMGLGLSTARTPSMTDWRLLTHPGLTQDSSLRPEIFQTKDPMQNAARASLIEDFSLRA